MSNDNSRRRFLQGGLALIPLVTLASQGLPVLAAEPRTTANPSASGSKPYSPRYFTAAEWAFVNAATEQIIPTDDLGPGAVTCGIPEFIDRQMDTPYGHGGLWYMQGPFITDQPPEMGYQQRLTPRDIYRFGIVACDKWCQQNKGKPFAQLDEQAQIEVLQALEKNAVPMDEMKSSLLFTYLVNNSKEGYFADPIYGGNRNMAGWKMIGFPGARADFMDWIDHPNEKYPLGPVSISGERG
ncbi:gluconate 2-dehydrogenase subunit 3 family protein [Pseudomonas syringae]|uniref:Gluconate 2-dehydrogenase n=1 Tax=Pseudomonas syringae TaxID=317 RepID=A0A085V507_PSESX|nr:gluconate 2-dehydrogenase subunit 3 family protein [Pseudomonas syringae]KFE50520.1 gluconate 2-dehydrogenase [Pseudomonas syringae]